MRNIIVADDGFGEAENNILLRSTKNQCTSKHMFS
jgi:hypothetical protein